jgi:hypothetical protein
MKKFDGLGSLLFLGTSVLLVITFFVGWCMNIFKILNGDFSHLDGLLVLRIVGIFIAPLGSILGLFFN